jgi:hypothetical protein
MSSKGLGLVLVLVGLAVLVVAAAADPLGVGGAAGFGWKQILGVAVGAVLAVLGVAKLRAPSP